MFEIDSVLAVVSIFSIIMLAAAVPALVVCSALLIHRINQRRRERD